MTDAPAHAGTIVSAARPTCPGCGTPVQPDWRFCAACGAAAQPEAFQRPADARARAAGKPATGYIPLPELRGAATPATGHTRRRRRRRRPLYRRPRVIVPSILLLAVLVVVAGATYQTSALLSTMRQVSTPPPVVTDNTYVEEGDPDRPSQPVTVDTGPAVEVLEEQGADRGLPESGGGSIIGSVQDLTHGAAVVSGVKEPSDEGFTVLVMGVDARPGEAIDIGVRPDAFMVLRFDPAANECRALSIPRDTRVELPGYGMSKINHALMVGGIPYQLLVTEDFLDIDIDHYLLIDFAAFSTLVDSVGGVTVDVPRDLEKNGEVRYIAGSHTFDGEEALAYARFRTYADDGDPDRVQRQWSVLAGLAERAKNRDLASDVRTLMPVLEEHLRTDLSVTELATIATEFGGSCVTGDGAEIDLLETTRVRLPDPILDRVEYFEDVRIGKARAQAEALLTGEDQETPPAATPTADRS